MTQRNIRRLAASCLFAAMALLTARAEGQHSGAGAACGAERFQPAINAIKQALADDGLPSVAIAVAEGGRVTCEAAFGWADLDRRIASTPSTMYSLASISKPFTATALMRLVEEGALDLQRPANDYLGAARLRAFEGKAEDATLHRLLTHTAGLPLHYQFFYEGGPAVPAMDDAIARYGIIVYPPGERYFYANFGYGVLERILERAGDRPYADVLRRAVLDPLALSETIVSDGAGLDGRRAALRYDAGKPIRPYTFDHVGASGVWSSARDLIRFGIFHLGHDAAGRPAVLPLETRRLMQRAHAAADAPGRARGLGWGIVAALEGQRQVAHTGSMPGVATMLSLYPDADVAIVVLTNVSNSAAVARIERALRSVVLPRAPAGATESGATRSSSEGRARTADAGLATALRGKWIGTVQLPGETIRVELDVRADDDVRLRVGAEVEAQVEGARLNGNWLTGRTSARLSPPDATPPAGRMDHRTTFTLARRGDRLSGWATAMSTATPTYGAVSFPLTLSKATEGRAP